MNIYAVLSFLGGLSMFLFGMSVMGGNLRLLSGGQTQGWLGKLCKTPLRGILLGVVVTALMQSSSATTVMVVGFVNAGIISLSQSVGVIMGANLGTTVTSWLLSLTSIGGSGFLQFLNPSFFSPLLAFAGVILITIFKKDKNHQLGYIFLGFTVLIYGMQLMSDTVRPLADVPEFTSFLTVFENPVFGLIAGALMTAVIQSSSASVGILQALTSSGTITVNSAIPIIMGQNIGTCATTLISGVGGDKNARRASFIHLYFNMIGSAIVLGAFYIIRIFGGFSEISEKLADAGSIAVIHTVFNLLSVIILLPFTKQLEKLALMTVRDGKDGKSQMFEANSEEYGILDDRFLSSPHFALSMAENALKRMCVLVNESMSMISGQLIGFEPSKNDAIIEKEKIIDSYETSLRSYLVRLSSNSDHQMSNKIQKIVFSLSDIERMGDNILNISNISEDLGNNEKIDEKTLSEIERCSTAVNDLVKTVFIYLQVDNNEKNNMIYALDETIKILINEVKKRNTARIIKYNEVEFGIAADEILVSLEQISSYAVNIFTTFKSKKNRLGKLQADGKNDNGFSVAVNMYLEQYKLPHTDY